jgi:carbamoyltransferase
MIILGISIDHDAGVCLIKDNKILTAINEERLSRIKNHTGFPYLALAEVLQINTLKKTDIAEIAIGGKINISFKKDQFESTLIRYKILDLIFSSFFFKTLIRNKLLFFFFKKTLISIFALKRTKTRLILRKLGFKQKISFIDHHDAHIFSSIAYQGPKDQLLLSFDAHGDGLASKTYLLKNTSLKKLTEIPFFDSLAYYYQYITKLLGFIPLQDEGKVMGLAAAGKTNPEIIDILKNRIVYDHGTFKNQGYFRGIEFNYLKTRLAKYTAKDIAFASQNLLEEYILKYLKELIRKYSLETNKISLSFSGGIFANVKLNQKISEAFNFKDIFVAPSMGDGGLALGAANFVLAKRKNKFFKLYSHCFLGNSIDQKLLLKLAKNKGYHPKALTQDKLTAKAIATLKKDGLIGIIEGKMEYGPRALGHRSIIALPNKKTITKLNKNLKRDDFMPFGPITTSKYYKLFINKDKYYKDRDCLKMMTITIPANDTVLKNKLAVNHLDNTIRLQIIKKNDNPFLYKLLNKLFEEQQLLPLLNTSFNYHGEPIVCTEANIIDTFNTCRLDLLISNNYIIS